MQVITLDRKKNKETNEFEYKYSIINTKYQVLTRKYRVYITDNQKEIFEWWFSKCDYVWNKLLNRYNKKGGNT